MRGTWTAAVLATSVVLGAGLAAEDGKTYGAGVTLPTGVSVKTVLDRPDAFVGKTVRVDGVVSAVCEEMGCWMELSDPETKQGLRFKVEDGVIVFPVAAKGKRASAQGTLERIDLATSDEHQSAHLTAEAEAAAKAAGKAAPKVAYLVRATGAVIY